MNEERMLELATFLTTIPEHKFNMNRWISGVMMTDSGDGELSNTLFNSKEWYDPNDCGTVCCIAGWAAAMKLDFKPMSYEMSDGSIARIAAEWLDLTDQEMTNLFYIDTNTVWSLFIEDCDYDYDSYSGEFYNISNKDAAYVIRQIVYEKFDINREIEEDEYEHLLYG